MHKIDAGDFMSAMKSPAPRMKVGGAPVLKDFKEFAVKVNVLDMAVGIILGVAFGKIVTTRECPRCVSMIPIRATRCPNCTSEPGTTAAAATSGT